MSKAVWPEDAAAFRWRGNFETVDAMQVRKHLLSALPFLFVLPLHAANAVTTGKFIVERPTLICLGFEWQITGDENRNSSVEVSFRKSGESAWRQALPLLRIGGEKIYRRDLGLDYTVPDAFAGSIFDLERATEYEARFQMGDPDGVKGEAIHTVKVRTHGEPIFDGDGAHRLFDVMAADYHIFEGLTIRNTDVAFYAGMKDVGGAKGLTVRNCRLEDIGIGVTSLYAGSQDFYIADNVMLGRDDPHRLLGWFSPGIYGANRLKSYYGVKLYGSGHVVCHNYVAYFHDGITVCTHGSPDQEEDRRAVSIDFYNNDIHLMADDFIESDGGGHNIRIMRNRGVNAAQCGLSAQPVYGGPAYFIRNVLYHVPTGSGLKFNVKPAGLVLYHNTVIAEGRPGDIFSNAHLRNNLFLGRDAPGREVFRFANATSYSTYDYNGYRLNPRSKDQFQWKSPRPGVLRDYELEGARFQAFGSLAELRAATGQEAHGIEVDYDIFENLRPPHPDQPHAVYHAHDLHFRLKPGSKAVDAGLRLPNVNDDHTGTAPDLGAYEVGKPPPLYGPRPAR